jgi:3'-phosphoadenosine 5'-phosphosulfate sulfotransferase (PAPS reductase)/FAD synthetase
MIRVLSLGAGVQSTTLALMAARGEIEAPDCAIFADTGWEPRAVYEHLDRLEDALPYPVYRVSAGNLRDDIEAKNSARSGRFAAVP